MAAAAAALAVATTGCGDGGGDGQAVGSATPVTPPSVSATTTAGAASTSSGPKVLAPTQSGVSATYNMETIILSVEDANSRYGPVTVFTFQLVNQGDKVFEGYNFPTPTLVYGAAGSPAENTVSISEGYGSGVQGSIPPGSRQTLKYAYKVTKDQLNPAVLTIGSLLWQGDFSTFQR